MSEEKNPLQYKVLKVKKLTWFRRLRHWYFVPTWVWNHTHIAQIEHEGKKLWVPIDPLSPTVEVDFWLAVWTKFYKKDYGRREAENLRIKQETAVENLLAESKQSEIPTVEVHKAESKEPLCPVCGLPLRDNEEKSLTSTGAYHTACWRDHPEIVRERRQEVHKNE